MAPVDAIAAREGGKALPTSCRPKAPLEPCWQGAVPIAGPERGESATERARESVSAIREVRARSRGCSSGERYGATVRTCSVLALYVSAPPQPQNVTRMERAMIFTTTPPYTFAPLRRELKRTVTASPGPI